MVEIWPITYALVARFHCFRPLSLFSLFSYMHRRPGLGASCMLVSAPSPGNAVQRQSFVTASLLIAVIIYICSCASCRQQQWSSEQVGTQKPSQLTAVNLHFNSILLPLIFAFISVQPYVTRHFNTHVRVLRLQRSPNNIGHHIHALDRFPYPSEKNCICCFRFCFC